MPEREPAEDGRQQVRCDDEALQGMCNGVKMAWEPRRFYAVVSALAMLRMCCQPVIGDAAGSTFRMPSP